MLHYAPFKTPSKLYEFLGKSQENPSISSQTNSVRQFYEGISKVKIQFAGGSILWQLWFGSYGGKKVSEPGAYVRYTLELFTNNFPMEAMMHNNQDVASENVELYILNMD